MPSSVNRRRLELPAPLHARLEEVARQRGQTTAALAATLLEGALAESATPDQPRAQLRELRAIRRELDAQSTALAVLVTGCAPIRQPQGQRGRSLDPALFREYRVTGAPGVSDPVAASRLAHLVFGEPTVRASLPAVVLEYLRLLCLADLIEQPEARQGYLQQAAALRARLDAVPSAAEL